MSHNRGPRRTWAEELSAPDIEDSEHTTGLTTGDLMTSPSPSVDPNRARECSPWSIRMIHMRLHMDRRLHPVGSSRLAEKGLSPSRLAGVSGTAHRGSHTPLRVASITATQGHYSPWGITHRSESCSDSGQLSSTGGDTDEDFIIKASEVVELRQEYSEFITLKDNAEIVLAEAMEATERLNTVFSQVRASMSRMSPRMKELFSVPSN
ncbi:hypothetical protein M422DRAFT_242122 [Sphaerobolus stellatus SS14]|nr:hypothetical protein M422DRAFT_242122 [Sphaerobolus stellatus SS14]